MRRAGHLAQDVLREAGPGQVRGTGGGPLTVLDPPGIQPDPDRPGDGPAGSGGAKRAGVLGAGATAPSGCTTRCARWGWRPPRPRPWRGSLRRKGRGPAASPASAPARPGAGSSIRPPTPAGSWTPPSTSWPAGARPSSSSSRTTTVAWLVAPGETSDAAIAVFDKGVAAHGVPQRLLTDNGAAHGPQPTGTRRTPGGARAGPRGRAHHRQALQTHHPGQERALPPDPAPLPRQAAPGRVHRRPPGPGRRLRPHPATPSAPTRACPGASPHSRRGTPPPSPTRPDPTECTTSPP